MSIIILCDVCEQHRLTGTRLTSVGCRTCEGTGQIRVEETLPCEECRLMGEPKQRICEWCSNANTAEPRRGRPSPFCSDTCRHDAKTAMSAGRM